MTDLRAECLAMAESLTDFAEMPFEGHPLVEVLHGIASQAAALLRRVADALPQEPQGDVVEAMAKGIYEADSEGGFDANDPRTFWRAANSYWPPHVWDSWLAIARAALSAAEPFIQARIAAAVEDGGWQPIETAPKDGTPILVYLGGPTDQYVVAWDCCDPGNWREIYGDQDAIFHPTHWRPLPDPPASPDPAGQQEEEG